MSSQNCLNSIHLKSMKLVSFPDAQTLTSMSIYVDIPSYAHLHSHPSVRILPSHPSVRTPSKKIGGEGEGARKNGRGERTEILYVVANSSQSEDAELRLFQTRRSNVVPFGVVSTVWTGPTFCQNQI